MPAAEPNPPLGRLGSFLRVQARSGASRPPQAGPGSLRPVQAPSGRFRLPQVGSGSLRSVQAPSGPPRLSHAHSYSSDRGRVPQRRRSAPRFGALNIGSQDAATECSRRHSAVARVHRALAAPRASRPRPPRCRVASVFAARVASCPARCLFTAPTDARAECLRPPAPKNLQRAGCDAEHAAKTLAPRTLTCARPPPSAPPAPRSIR